MKTQNTSFLCISQSLCSSPHKLRETGELEKGTNSTWQMQEQHQKARRCKSTHQQSPRRLARKRRGIFHPPAPASCQVPGCRKQSAHVRSNREGSTPAKGCKWYSLVRPVSHNLKLWQRLNFKLSWNVQSGQMFESASAETKNFIHSLP